MHKYQNKKWSKEMLISTAIMGILALILIFIGYHQGGGKHLLGIKGAMSMIIQIIPLLVLSLIVGGMVNVLIPQAVISKWLGAESGFKGILLATIAGLLAPGGPYTILPILAGLFQTGISIGVIMAFYSAKFLCGFTRLPIEIGIVGWKFAIVRLATTFFLPPIIGLLANAFFSKFS
ncbi:MAG: hypothetical protein AMJ45_04440 [Syntrophobacter sp. DG_60]|nr:MAG: hypothetical protein AMJ45_04440 [Syntrophobacter sp. DG_60]